LKQYFALGSYTEAILFGTGEVFQGKGKGISLCSLEEGRIEILGEIPVRNPSFLCIDEAKQKIYAVNEMKEYLGEEGGGLTQLSYTADFSMAVEGTWNAGGKDPCHIAIAPDGQLVAIANFASGSITTFPLDEKGNVVGQGRNIMQHTGSSVHPVRQRGPHAHSCIFNRDHQLLVPDLGIDRVVVYDYEKAGLSVNDSMTIPVPAGSGPRYGEYSRDGGHFYLIDEISSQVMHYTNDKGQLKFQQTVNTLPGDFRGNNICSDLHLTPDGTKLYASNRGHDSIVCFRVEDKGDLTFLERSPCGGRTPRNFAIDPSGSHLLVGNQDSDRISIFRIEPDGHLEMVNNWETGSPVCIMFFNA